jgi:hypothetical protein
MAYTQLFSAPIATPVTGQVYGSPVSVNRHRNLIVTATFAYGSGGTTAKVWLQTSVDNGVTWFDVANFAFALATAVRINKLTGDAEVAANYTPTDAALADNTIKDGLLGTMYRGKVTSTGTYVNTAIRLEILTKESA